MTSKTQKLFTKSNIINGVIIIALAVVVFVPAAKTLLIRALMGVGLFRADVAEQITPVPVADDMVFEDAGGKTINLHKLKGKVVFLNFWATWCPPCRAEMPAINSLHQTLKADTNIVFIMVDADSDLKSAGQFMAKYQYQLPLYQAVSNVPPNIYNGTLPTTVILDKNGALAFRREGMANYDTGAVEEFLTKHSLAK
jgi:thiol-disulfide isomerase/thioredoxin